MDILRTPDNCFENLPDFDYTPHYLTIKTGLSESSEFDCEIDDNHDSGLRVHYLDEGPADGKTILLMHGEPSWSFLYRKMVSGLVELGFRVVVPDLIGFGRSDKLPQRSDYTYYRHVSWMTDWLHQLDLNDTLLFCQDWGGLIGLRLLAAEPQRFSGAIAANTWLPTGDVEPSKSFLEWQNFSQTVTELPIGQILQGATVTQLSSKVVAAYEAPYPSEDYKAGARQFPILVPTNPDDVESERNRDAWKSLAKFDKPFLTAFSDKDPVTAGGEKHFQKMIPGCAGQNHISIKGGGHFLQEDKSEELITVINQFVKHNGL